MSPGAHCWRRRSRSSSCTSSISPASLPVGSTRRRLPLGLRGARGRRSRRSRPAGGSPPAGGAAALARRRAFLVWMAAAVVYGRVHTSAYPVADARRDGGEVRSNTHSSPRPCAAPAANAGPLSPVWSVALWSGAATVVGIAQFFGADIFLAGTVGRGRPRSSRPPTSRRSPPGHSSSASSPSRYRVSRHAHPGGDRDAERRARDDRRRSRRIGARPRHCATCTRRRPAPSARARTATSRRDRRRRSRRRPRRGCDTRQRPRCVRALPRRIGQSLAADEGADVCASHAPRLDWLRDLERPSGARRRLGGIRRAGELRAVPSGRARALPGRGAARVSVGSAGAPVRRAELVAPGARGSRRHRAAHSGSRSERRHGSP